MLVDLTPDRLTLLNELLTDQAKRRSGLGIADQPSRHIDDLKLAKLRYGHRAGITTTDGGTNSATLAELLRPGDMPDNDPLQIDSRKLNIISIVSPNQIMLDATSGPHQIHRRWITIDAPILLRNMADPTDDGLYRIIDFTPDDALNPVFVTVTLDRDLLSTSIPNDSGAYFHGAWGLTETDRLMTVVNTHRADQVAVGRISNQWVCLARPRVRGLLLTDLGPATVTLDAIVPSEATFVPGELDSNNHFRPVKEHDYDRVVVLRVRNLDESLSVPRKTLIYADLWGDHWELDYASCNISNVYFPNWEPPT